MTRRRIRSVLALAALFLAAAGAAPPKASSKAPSTPASRQRAVEQGLQEGMARRRVPGVSMVVVNDGKVEWTQAYGIRRAGTAERITTQTLFQAASISKPVAATGALRLVQSGKLDLDADVNARLRSWRVPAGRYASQGPVTLRKILSHSAGLTVHGFRGYARGEAVPTLPQVLDGTSPANSVPIRVETPPGPWKYSGGGYVILQQLLADVTGKPFATLMRELVLDPAGMKQSTFEQPLPARLVPRAAVAHDWDGVPLPGDWHTHPELAAAGLWTTPSDLARFALALRDAWLGKSGDLLDQRTARLMMTRTAGDFGLGVRVDGTGDSLHFSHSGANYGFRCYMVMYPKTGDGAVVMTNGSGGDELMMEIAHSVARVYGWPDYKPDQH